MFLTLKSAEYYCEANNIEVTRVRGTYRVIELNVSGATEYECRTLEEVRDAVGEILQLRKDRDG